MNTDQLQRIESVIKSPETVVESEQETLDRDRCLDLFINSNMGLTRSDHYEAGWKAAKAYYGNKQ